MRTFSQIEHTNLRYEVVEQIRFAIIEGRLRPNDHIVESALTRELGVSRTPVREALILLEREGLVVSQPNRGSFVRAFDPESVSAIFEMRNTLENFAAELLVARFEEADAAHLEQLIQSQRHHIDQRDFEGVRRTDMTFHQYLVERAGNPLLLRSWKELVAQIAAILYIRAEACPDYDEYQATEDHQRLLDAYRSRDLATIKREHVHINARVANECRDAMIRLKQVAG